MLYKLNCLYFKNYLSPCLLNLALCSKVQVIISFPPNLITRIAAEEQFEDDDSIFSNNFYLSFVSLICKPNRAELSQLAYSFQR